MKNRKSANKNSHSARTAKVVGAMVFGRPIVKQNSQAKALEKKAADAIKRFRSAEVAEKKLAPLTREYNGKTYRVQPELDGTFTFGAHNYDSLTQIANEIIAPYLSKGSKARVSGPAFFRVNLGARVANKEARARKSADSKGNDETDRALIKAAKLIEGVDARGMPSTARTLLESSLRDLQRALFVRKAAK